MKTKSIFLSVVILLVAGALVCPAHAQQMKSVKIGVISPLSGPLTFIGTSMLRCVQLMVKEINERGTTGNGPGLLVGGQRYKLEIVNYDDSADPSKSVAGMRKLAEMYNVPCGSRPLWHAPGLGNSRGQRGAQGPVQRSFDLRSIPQEGQPPLHSGACARACTTGIPWPRRPSRKDTRRQPCSPTSMKPTCRGARGSARSSQASAGRLSGVEAVDIKNTTDYHSIMTSFKAKNPGCHIRRDL